jgi:glycosyltransferase involved in cell wall biosynthesis
MLDYWTKKMNRILIHSDYIGKKSGYAREIRELYPYWVKSGYEVAQVGLDYNGYPLDNDIRVYPADIKKTRSRFAPEILDYAIEDFKPDIVLVNNDYYIFRHIGLELAHPGNWKLCFWGLCDGEGLSFYAEEGVKWVHQHVYHTNFTKDQVQSYCPNIGGEVIYPPVNPEIFYPLEKDKLRKQLGIEDKKVLICCARPQERKLIPLLLESLKLILQKRDDVILILVAGGHHLKNDQGFEVGTLVDRFIQKFGLENNVVIPLTKDKRPIEDDTLNIQYNVADINILATAGEGFGLPYCEAASCGLPSIGVDHSACKEVCEQVGWTIPKGNGIYTYDGVKHYLYEPGNLSKKILELLDKPEEIKKRGQDALKFARSITPEKQANKFIEIFKNINNKERYINLL